MSWAVLVRLATVALIKWLKVVQSLRHDHASVLDHALAHLLQVALTGQQSAQLFRKQVVRVFELGYFKLVDVLDGRMLHVLLALTCYFL